MFLKAKLACEFGVGTARRFPALGHPAAGRDAEAPCRPKSSLIYPRLTARNNLFQHQNLLPKLGLPTRRSSATGAVDERVFNTTPDEVTLWYDLTRTSWAVGFCNTGPARGGVESPTCNRAGAQTPIWQKKS